MVAEPKDLPAPGGCEPLRYCRSVHARLVTRPGPVCLADVPAWVREMPDDEAFMALALCNTHGELTPIERGMHALKSGMDVKAYAERVGRARTTVQDEVKAARVASAVTHVRHELPHRLLAAIHAAPSWLWPALVAAAAADDWTVERALVGSVVGIFTLTCLSALFYRAFRLLGHKPIVPSLTFTLSQRTLRPSLCIPPIS